MRQMMEGFHTDITIYNNALSFRFSVDFIISDVCLERLAIKDQDLFIFTPESKSVIKSEGSCFGDHGFLDFTDISIMAGHLLCKSIIVFLRDHELLILNDIILHALEETYKCSALLNCQLLTQYCHQR